MPKKSNKKTNSTNMPLHPLCALFPPADEPTLDALTEDIRKNGLREPITTYQGQVVDGQNRLICCERAGVEPHFEEYAGNPEDLFQFILSKNVSRRHLTLGQKALIADEMSASSDDENVNPQICGSFTQVEAAKVMVISERSVQDAARLRREALPELIAEVRRGEKTIHAALQEIKPPKTKADKVSAEQSETKPSKANKDDAMPDTPDDVVGENAQVPADVAPETVPTPKSQSKFDCAVGKLRDLLTSVEGFCTLFEEADDLADGELQDEEVAELLRTATDVFTALVKQLDTYYDEEDADSEDEADSESEDEEEIHQDDEDDDEEYIDEEDDYAEAYATYLDDDYIDADEL